MHNFHIMPMLVEKKNIKRQESFLVFYITS